MESAHFSLGVVKAIMRVLLSEDIEITPSQASEHVLLRLWLLYMLRLLVLFLFKVVAFSLVTSNRLLVFLLRTLCWFGQAHSLVHIDLFSIFEMQEVLFALQVVERVWVNLLHYDHLSIDIRRESFVEVELADGAHQVFFFLLNEFPLISNDLHPE